MLSGEQKLTWQVAKSPSIKVWQVEQKKTVAKPTKKRKALYYSIENFSLRTQFFLDPSLWEFHLQLLATISLKLLLNSRRRPSSSSEHVRTCVAGYTCPVRALTHLFQLCCNSPRLSVKCNLNGTRNCLSYNSYYACDDLCLVLTTDRDPHPSHVSGPQQAMGYRVKRVPSSLQVWGRFPEGVVLQRIPYHSWEL